MKEGKRRGEKEKGETESERRGEGTFWEVSEVKWKVSEVKWTQRVNEKRVKWEMRESSEEKEERREREESERREWSEREVIWVQSFGSRDFGNLKNFWKGKKILNCWVGKWNRKEREQSFTKKKGGIETKVGQEIIS